MMKIAVFSTKPYDRKLLDRANRDFKYNLVYFESRLSEETVDLARGFTTVCLSVNDQADRAVQKRLRSGGTTLVALRGAGFNNVDLNAAAELKLTVVRVPAYSPYAVAEFTVAPMLTLNRKLHRTWQRTRENNFALHGLLGFDMHEKTVGIVGTGRIGTRTAHILSGMGCRLVGHDPKPSLECERLGVRYVDLDTLLRSPHIVTLHCPLTPETHRLIDARRLSQMRRSAMPINTSRGAVVDTAAVIAALKSGHLGFLGLDVYEQEADLFFEDLSERVIQDDVFQRLLTFPNVLISGHQGFFHARSTGGDRAHHAGEYPLHRRGRRLLQRHPAAPGSEKRAIDPAPELTHTDKTGSRA